MTSIPPKEILLLGPGPSPVHPRVRQALSWPVLGHLDPDFLEIMNQTMDLLRKVFQTDYQFTIPISGTGSAGMEASIVNFVEPGDRVIVGVNGVFGNRLADVASRCGAQVIEVTSPWGRPIDADDLCRTIKRNSGIKAVVVVHAETSTGVLQDLDPIVSTAKEYGALIIVDAVTSLGGIPIRVGDLGLDVVYSGTQKCLSCPPGLAPFTVSPQALKVLESRSSKVQSWYLDLSMISRYWGKERFYHHTAPVNMIYAIFEALRLIDEERLEARFVRHNKVSKALVSGLKAYGFGILPDEQWRLPSLTATILPEGLDDLKSRQTLRKEHLIEVGGGLGDLKGKIWRIGLMGHGAKWENVERLLCALEDVFRKVGYKSPKAAEVVAEARTAYDSL